jgi:heptosyltransferase-1
MRVLIVKTSSLGDLIHTLPAVTDAARAVPGIRFDWVAEEGFAEIPFWHPTVGRVIPVALRRWRKNWLGAWRSGEIPAFWRQLRELEYACIIDAQGLLKSALLTRLARGPRCGLDFRSAREPLAALLYSRRFAVPRNLHAIERVRQLFAAALGYDYDPATLDYGLADNAFVPGEDNDGTRSLVFLHGTTWPEKRLPAECWIELARLAGLDGYRVLLPWGNAREWDAARDVAAGADNARVLPRLNLTEIAGVLAGAAGVIGVDTGLAHLAAALGRPALTVYTATFPALTGARGDNQCCVVLGRAEQSALKIPGLRVENPPDGVHAEALWNLWKYRQGKPVVMPGCPCPAPSGAKRVNPLPADFPKRSCP